MWRKIKEEKVTLGLIIALGAIPRLVLAIGHPLWRDEAFIFFTTRDNNFFDLLLQRHWDTAHPPLYFIFLHFWQKISIDPFFLRFPSILASLASLGLVYILAKKNMPKNRLLPFITTFVFALSHTQVSLGFQIRPYAFEILLMLSSLILFPQLLENKKASLEKIFAFATINFFAFFEDYSSLWLFFSYGIFLGYLFLKTCAFQAKKSFQVRNIFFGLLLTIYLCSPWLPIMITNLPKSLALEEYIGRVSWKNVVWELPFFTGTTKKDMPIELGMIKNLSTWGLIVAGLASLGIIITIFKKDKKSRNWGVLLLIMSLGPPIVSYLFSLHLAPIFLAKNLVITNIALLFGISLLLAKMVSLPKGNLSVILLVIIIGFIVINFIAGFPTTYIDPPHNWIKVRDLLLRRYSAEEQKYIITPQPAWELAVLKYYDFVNSVPHFYIFESNKTSLFKVKGLREGNNKPFHIFLALQTKENGVLNEGEKQKVRGLSEALDCSQFIIYPVEFVYFAECKFSP